MTRAGSWRAVVLGVAMIALAIVGPNAIERVRRGRDAEQVCRAVEAGRNDEAVRLSRTFTGADGAARIATECGCWALLAQGRRAECVAQLELVLEAGQAAAWLPDPVLAQLVVDTRRAEGRHAQAAELAGRLAESSPHDVTSRVLEVMSRSAIEGEDRALSALARRIAGAPVEGAVRDRIVLARFAGRRGDPEAALRALGEERPPIDHPLAEAFAIERAAAFAAAGRLEGVRRSYEAWRGDGGDPARARALYALTLSEAPLRDPDRSFVALLAEAAADWRRIDDPDVVRRLHERLIAHHIADRRIEDALAVFDAASERGIALRAITREQIEHSRVEAIAAEAAQGESHLAALRFESPEPGILLVAPGLERPPDAGYEAFELEADRPLRVERAPAPTPVRWVLRDRDGALRASGSAWPSMGQGAHVRIEPREASVAASPPILPPRPADGRRRVFALVLDCADWRLIEYLRARGELPFLDAALAEGARAVLDSRPALTAAAMAKLVRPDLGEPVSFVGLAHRLGLELGGLASVGRNPLEFLSAFLPAAPDLFEVVGGGDLVAANMLFSHGMIDGGRSAEKVGPFGERRMADPIRAYRPLEPDVVGRHPLLVARPGTRSQVETVASSLDAARAMAVDGEVDLLLLRVEALDILTHALFGELTVAEQDDGQRALLAVYRYIDERLAEVRAALDADDVLVVMSDHGIRTPMEHEPDALFVAIGAGVPRTRAPGRPALQGVARVLAALLGVETSWPDTGVAAWADGLRERFASSAGDR